MALSPTPDQETDIFEARIADLGEKELLDGFLHGVTALTEDAVELELIDMPEEGGQLPVLSLLERIDEAVHENPEPHQELSVKLAKLFEVVSKPSMEEKVVMLDASSNGDGQVIYSRKVDPEGAMKSFIEERARRRAQAAAEEEARAARSQARRQLKYQERERETERLRRQQEKRQKSQETKAWRKQRMLAHKRAVMLSQQRAEWRSRRHEIDELLSAGELEVLPYLHLPREATATALGIERTASSNRILSAKRRLGLETTEDLAIWALEHGVEYDVTKPPSMETFTIRERQVAHRLTKRNPDIVAEIGSSKKQVARAITSLFDKLGTRNRAEVAIIARMYGFEPLPEELEEPKDVPRALRRFTELEREVVSRMFMPYHIVAAAAGVSEYAVPHAVERALTRADVRGRFALADKLMDEGYEFDVPKPKRPIHEVLTDEELKLINSLGDELDRDVAKDHGLGEDEFGDKITYARTKTGARTRLELYLMVKNYSDGSGRPEYHNVLSKEERFFRALGIEPRPLEEVRHLLQYATPRQAEYLEAYYFTDSDASWRDIAQEFCVVREAAIQAGSKGLARIRRHLESSGGSS